MRFLSCRAALDPQAPPVAGVHRVLVLGDSMVFGQGVGPNETFPYFLQNALNAADPAGVYEAVNLGICGYNLWNSWTEFRRRDLEASSIVFVLCANDASPFVRTLKFPDKDETGSWQPGQAGHAGVQHTLGEIAAFAAQRSVPVTMAFYATYLDSTPKSPAVMLERACAAHGLTFVDLSKLITVAKTSVSDLCVSDADRHPNGEAHDLAARALVSALRAKRLLNRTQGAANQVFAVLRAGWQTTAARRPTPLNGIEWVAQTLAAKEVSARRALDEAGFADFAAQANALRAELRQAGVGLHRGWRAGAMLELAETADTDLVREMFTIEESLLLVHEAQALHAIVAAVPIRPETYDAEAARAARDFLDQPGGERSSDAAVAAAMASVAESRERLGACVAQDPHAAQSLALFDRWAARLAVFRDDLTAAIADARRMIAATRDLPEDASPRIIAGIMAIGVQAGTAGFTNAAAWLAAICGPEEIRDLYTDITVSLDAKGLTAKAHLVLEADYRWPQRRAVRESVAVNGDKAQLLCRFRIPFLRAGRLRLILDGDLAPPCDDGAGRVRRVRITASGREVVLEGATAAFSGGRRQVFPWITL